MKTASLELAKQLKEAGYPQDTKFYWRWPSEEFDYGKSDYEDNIASPTADELLERLPKRILGNDKHKMLFLTIHLNENYHSVAYQTFMGDVEFQENEKIVADAVAKMWLYLKKEGLV